MSDLKPIRVWVRFSEQKVQKLDRLAQHQNITRSRLLREIVEAWLSEQPDRLEESERGNRRFYDQSEYMRQKAQAEKNSLRACQRQITDLAVSIERAIQEIQNFQIPENDENFLEPKDL